MTTFANQPLFDAKLDTVRIGPLRARQAVLNGVSGHGAPIVPQGLEAREIDHAGRLVADSPRELQSRIEAIERHIDGGPQPLTLDDGRTFAGCVMTQAQFDPPVAIGPRTASRFRVRYLQLTPAAEQRP
ncbi:MAG: hypothetical protein AAGI53_17575 [Planctomycetota bacterium]